MTFGRNVQVEQVVQFSPMPSASSVAPEPVGFVLLPAVLSLVRQMRETGIPVSTSELIDAQHALQKVDLLDRSQVRTALAATLVKRTDDLAAFNLLFDIHLRLRQRATREGATDGGRPGSTRTEIRTSLDRTRAGDGDESGATALFEMIMEAIRRGDPDALRTLAKMAVARFGGLDSQPGASERYFMYRILRALDLSRLMTEMLAAARDDAGKDGADERRLRGELAERIEAFKKLLAGQVRDQLTDSRGADEAGQPLELLETDEVDFLGASPRQLAAMRELIRPLARTLATKMARRRHRRTGGRLDIRRTVRRSLSSGGVLLDPAFRRPKVSRPDLFLLCDISGSVAEFASFTLTLLQAIHAEFSRMRSFAFIDGIDEVSDHIRDVDSFLEVRHVLYRADVVRDDGHSDYGAVLERFWERYGVDVDSRSTIIITGDGRANHRKARVDMLHAMHARARRVYLLNPEPEADWNTTDSIVDTYAPALDGVFQVRNLRQLGEAVFRIT